MNKRHIQFFLTTSSIFFSLIFINCASYGIGGVYNSSKQAELGGYIYVDSKYTETSVSYMVNQSDNDKQSLGIAFSLKFPVSFWRVTVFPLANIEYQNVSYETGSFGWVRFGGGLDFSLTDSFYLRTQLMYAPGLFSNNTNIISLNRDPCPSVKLGLGWRPNASNKNTKKETPARTTSSTTPRTTASESITANNFERRVFELTNVERAKHGVPPLQWDNKLGAAARAHSEDMARNNFMSHTGSNGSNLGERVTRAGFNWSRVAENVAAGQQTPEAVINSWMNSPGHRTNILDPTLTHLGVGFVSNRWTQNFGTPR